MSESTQNVSEFLVKWKQLFYDVDIFVKEKTSVTSIKAVLALHSPVLHALIRLYKTNGFYIIIICTLNSKHQEFEFNKILILTLKHRYEYAGRDNSSSSVPGSHCSTSSSSSSSSSSSPSSPRMRIDLPTISELGKNYK